MVPGDPAVYSEALIGPANLFRQSDREFEAPCICFEGWELIHKPIRAYSIDLVGKDDPYSFD